MGTNSTSTQQQQSQVSNPWAPTAPALQNLIAQFSSGGGSLTPAQQAALTSLSGGASSIPNMGSIATPGVENLFGAAQPGLGILGQAYNNFSNSISPIASGAGLNPVSIPSIPGYNPNPAIDTNPYDTPGFGTALNTMNTDITNQMNGMFAAGGRSGTGSPGGGPSNAMNEQALARGLSQGEGQLVANESNTLQQEQLQNEGMNLQQLLGLTGANLQGAGLGIQQNMGLTQEQLNALQSELTGGINTAGSMTNLPIQAILSGVQGASAIPGLWTAPGATQLQAADVAQGLPYQNLSPELQAIMGVAGLGGQVQGTGSSTTTQPVNPWTTGLGAGLGVMSMIPGLKSAFGS